MGKLTAAQRQWIEGLGAGATAATAPNPPPPNPPPQNATSPNAAPPLGFSPFRDVPLNEKPDPKTLDLGLGPIAQAAARKAGADAFERDAREAEQQIARMNRALADAEAWITNLSQPELQKLSAALVMAEVRKRFPEVTGIESWLAAHGKSVPDTLRDRMPKPKALVRTVENTLKARNADGLWGITKQPAQIIADRLLAAYVAALPSGVTADVAGGVVQISIEGQAVHVKAAGGAVEATAGKAGAEVSLTHDDFAITVRNDGWKGFDPTVRAQWQSLQDDTKHVLALKASGKQVEFEAEWAKLQERFTATAKLSQQTLSATVDWLKKDSADQTLARAGASAEVDLKELDGTLSAFYKDRTAEAALAATFAADKVAAKLEVTAVKTGTVVTASFERSLEETKVALEAMAKGGFAVSAELAKKADGLNAKLAVVRERKDLKLAAEIEATLQEVRGTIRIELQKGPFALKASGSASSAGTGEAKAQIDIALGEGRVFRSGNEKLSFAASVSDKTWKFEAAFSIGEPVETSSVEDLLTTADQQIRKLYEMAGDKGLRSIADLKAVEAQMQKVLDPIKSAADKAKTLKKKSDIAVSFGLSIQGDWPAGGHAAAPAGMFSAKIQF